MTKKFARRHGAKWRLVALGIGLLSCFPLALQAQPKNGSPGANVFEGQYCGWSTFTGKTSAAQALEADPSLDPEQGCWSIDRERSEVRLGMGSGMLNGTYKDPYRTESLSGRRLSFFVQNHLDDLVLEVGLRQSVLQDSSGLVEYRAHAVQLGVGGKWEVSESWEAQVLATLTAHPAGAQLTSPGMSGATGEVSILGLEVPAYWRQDRWFAGGRLALGAGGTGTNDQTHQVRETLALSLEGGVIF